MSAKWIWTILAIGLPLVSPIWSRAQDFEPIQNLSGTTTSNSFDPQLAATGTNLFLVWEDGNKPGPFNTCNQNQQCQVLFRRSIDGGATWDPPLNQPAVTLSAEGTRSIFPRVAASGNVVLIFWGDFTNGDFVYRRSTDAGQTFGPIQVLYADFGSLGSPHVVASGSRIHVVWFGACIPSSSSCVRYTRSTDAGATFEPAMLVSAAVPDQRPRLAVDGNTVAIVSHQGGPGGGPISFRVSTDAGATFGPFVNLSEALAQPNGTDPQVAVRGSNVHVVWHETAIGGLDDILYRRSTDGGVNFTPIQNLSNSGVAGANPKVSVSGDNVYVIWPDFCSPCDIVLRRSADNGATFEALQTFSSTSGGFPEVAANGSTVYAVWEYTGSVSSFDILVRRSVDGGVTWDPPLDQPATNLSANQGQSVLPRVVLGGSNAYVIWADNALGNWEIFFRRAVGPPPPPVPIVLVHGWCGSPASFGQLAQFLFEDLNAAVFPFDYHGSNSFVPSFLDRGNLRRLAGQLARYVRDNMTAAGANQVDVVAHSMGGLLARIWMANLARQSDGTTVEYGNEIRRLVMTGTPNFGGDWPRGQVPGCDEDERVVAEAQKEQMRFGSELLKELNETWNVAVSSSITPTNILTVAGCGGVLRLTGVCRTDGVVLAASAALPVESPDYHPPRYVDRVHASFLGVNSIVDVDARDHETYILIRQFLEAGMAETGFVPSVVPGLMVVPLIDETGGVFSAMRQVEFGEQSPSRRGRERVLPNCTDPTLSAEFTAEAPSSPLTGWWTLIDVAEGCWMVQATSRMRGVMYESGVQAVAVDQGRPTVADPLVMQPQ